MRNALMHIRNCEVPTDMKQMAKGVMQQHKRLDKISLKQKRMRNKLMHIRNCDVPTDVKQMAKGVMLARPTFAACLN